MRARKEAQQPGCEDTAAGTSAPQHAADRSPLRVGLLTGDWPHRTRGAWAERDMVPAQLADISFERLVAAPPQLIVLDEACEDAQAVADCWHLHDLLSVPVVALSRDATADQVVALLERGADDVLTGDLDTALTVAQLAAILRRTPRQTQPGMESLLQFDDVQVDLTRRVVHRPDGSQSLSRTEFDLLLALLRAGGRTCTHRDLLIRVWGTECQSASHYLRLYIRYLRQKIEQDPRRPRRILNAWGKGYRLVLGQSDERPRGAEDSAGSTHSFPSRVVSAAAAVG